MCVTYIYIYGITTGSGNRNFGQIGIGKRSVFTVPYRDVAALATKVQTTICEISRENAIAHEKVLQKVMEGRPVIPMGFGVIAKDKKCVKEILEKGYASFKDVLRRINQKVQINVSISWDLDKLFLDILREDGKIRELRERVVRNPPMETSNERIELGKMVKSALDEKRERYLGEIKGVFGGLSEEFAENKLTSDKMIMNASFLVGKSREDEFYKKVDELEERYGGRVEILVVGPLPPYHFTKMGIKKADFEEIETARKTLGLSQEATSTEIEAIHRNLAYRYHPDRNPDSGAEQQFKKIERAYQALKNYSKHYPFSPCSFRKPDVEQTIIIEVR